MILYRFSNSKYSISNLKRIGILESLYTYCITSGQIALDNLKKDIYKKYGKKCFPLRLPKEKIKYFNGIRAYVGFNIGSIEVVKSKRRNGEPKMTYRKLFFLGIQGIFGFSSKPLTFIAILGFIISFGSLIVSAYAFYFKVRYGTTILGWDFGLSSIYFLSGIQLFALSIIGKYVGNIFLEVKGRPSYIIQEKV